MAFAAPSDDHLLRGAEHFHAGRFTDALVEFQVAERLGANADASWYAAATLVKLGRPEEAVEAFDLAERKSPGAGDALLSYYRALACYESRLYFCARKWLKQVEEGASEKVVAQARKIRADMDAALAKQPSNDNVQWYLEKGREALRTQHPFLAEAYFQEGLALSERRKETYRKLELTRMLQQARSLTESPERTP